MLSLSKFIKWEKADPVPALLDFFQGLSRSISAGLLAWFLGENCLAYAWEREPGSAASNQDLSWPECRGFAPYTGS